MLMDEEIWKDIEGYEGYYQVSSLGRVRSVDRVVEYKDGTKHFYKGQILRLIVKSNGYVQVTLCKDKKHFNALIHRLVAKAFLPNPNNYEEVNHKDETPSHNNVDNLEFCGRTYNNNYGTRNQRSAEKQSKKVYQYTLNNQLVKIWKSIAECRSNGYNNVERCCNGTLNKVKGFKWSYKPLEAPINISNN